MIRNRSTRVLATIGVTAALLAAMAGPAAITAAPAPLTIGYGTQFDLADLSGANPEAVEPGGHVAFEIWARNDGTSNISKLFLTGLTTGTFHSATTITTPTTSGSCGEGSGGDVQLQCSWLQITPGTTIQVQVVFTTPTQPASMPVDFEWSTAGFVDETKGKNKSRGDAFKQMDSVVLDDDADTFAGEYLVEGDSLIVGTNPSLNRQNPQSTTINAPGLNIAVTAAEDSNINECTALFSSCFGQASVINVGGGADFTAVGGFTVDIVFNVSKPGATLLHIFDDGTVDEAFVECGEVPVAPCYQVTNGQGKTFGTALLNENGKIFGH
jgi:hypothetical protein